MLRIEAEGTDAIEQAKRSLNGHDTNAVRKVVIEIEWATPVESGSNDNPDLLPEQTQEPPRGDIQPAVLEIIHESDVPLKVSEIVEISDFDTDAISPQASKLWQKGLVVRTNSVPYKYLEVTDYGKQFLGEN